MAYKVSSFIVFLLISNVMLFTMNQAVSARSIAGKNSKTHDEKKEPEFFFKSDGRVHIPGIGPIGFPPQFGLNPGNPFGGGIGGGGAGAGTGPSGRGYVPGGDDTFVPNPGFEVPIPGGGHSAPGAVLP